MFLATRLRVTFSQAVHGRDRGRMQVDSLGKEGNYLVNPEAWNKSQPFACTYHANWSTASRGVTNKKKRSPPMPTYVWPKADSACLLTLS